MTIELRKLVEHSENQKIYGYEGITNLQEKIEKSKWIKPIIVAKYSHIMDREDVIISGHRRYYVAKELKYNEIPFSYIEFKNKFEEIEMLLLENEYRDKSKLQKVREAERWEEIEREKAKQNLGGDRKSKEYKNNKSIVENFPQLIIDETDKEIIDNTTQNNNIGSKTRDNVASKVGFGSGRDYEKSKKVVKKIDELEKQGKKEEGGVL